MVCFMYTEDVPGFREDIMAAPILLPSAKDQVQSGIWNILC